MKCYSGLFLFLLCVGTVVPALADVMKEQRIFAGSSHLSDLSKSMYITPVQNAELKNIFLSGNLNAVLVQATVTGKKNRYFVSYNRGENPSLTKKEISKNDYDILMKISQPWMGMP